MLAERMYGCRSKSIEFHRPLTAVIKAVNEVVLAQRSFVVGVTIISPEVTECLDLPIGTIIGSFQTRCPNCSKNKISAVEKHKVTSSKTSTGGMPRMEVSGDKFMNESAMWVINESGVGSGL